MIIFHVDTLFSFFKFLLEYTCLTMLCQFLLYSKMNQLYIYIYPLFFGFPSHLGHHSALSRVPCAIQYVLISYLFYTQYQQHICVDRVSQLPPPSFPPWYPYICSLHLCLYFCFANKITYTIFLDSTYMRKYTIFVCLFLKLKILYKMSSHSI